jgi:hypothetical protein
MLNYLVSMKTVKSSKAADARRDILQSLKLAVVHGATWRYDHLVALAQQAGATDEEIDDVAHAALQSLLNGAELPLTAGELAQDWPVAHSCR